MGYYTEVQQPTYRAATAAPFAAAAGADIFFVIEGSATKEVLVRRITISGLSLTDVEYVTVVAEKFSTAASGGTATSLTKVPLDTLFDAATANIVKAYTVAPTQGNLVGTVASRRVLAEDTTAAAGGTPGTIEFDFTRHDTGGVMLRGVAQGLGLAFAAAPASAVTMALEVEWGEG